MDVSFLDVNKHNLNNVLIDILRFNKPRTASRSRIRNVTSSCRMWQLFMCMFAVLSVNGYNVVQIVQHYEEKEQKQEQEQEQFIELCSAIYTFIISSHSDPQLYNLYVMGTPGLVSEYTDLKQILPNQNTYMCVYNPNPNPDTHYISHYFTIIHDGTSYYLNSSYGSDFVCVTQYTTLLDLSEWNMFNDALKRYYHNGIEKQTQSNTRKRHESRQCIERFYYKYFMNEPEHKKQKTAHGQVGTGKRGNEPKGTQAELELVLGISCLRIGVIERYKEHMSDVVTHVLSNKPS